MESIFLQCFCCCQCGSIDLLSHHALLLNRAMSGSVGAKGCLLNILGKIVIWGAFSKSCGLAWCTGHTMSDPQCLSLLTVSYQTERIFDILFIYRPIVVFMKVKTIVYQGKSYIIAKRNF